MESEVYLEETRNDEDSSRDTLPDTLPLATISVMEAKNIEKSNSEVAYGKANFGPITPDADRENGEVLVDLLKSPATWVSSSSGGDEVAGSELSPTTPKEDVFDPFAPGPDELMLAPRCKKYLEDSGNHVWRRLNFDSGIELEPIEVGKVVDGVDSMESLSQEQLFLETLYESMLEAIVSQRVEAPEAEGGIAETLPLDTDCAGFRTPGSLPLLNGVAETCPGAPVKPRRKLKNIDLGLCRKLEF